MTNEATYNIPIELHTTGSYTLSELKEKLLAYAHLLVGSSNKIDGPSKNLNIQKVNSLDELDDWTRRFVGVIQLDEDDMNGRKAREEYLMEKYG